MMLVLWRATALAVALVSALSWKATASLSAEAPRAKVEAVADQDLRESLVFGGKPRSYRAFIPESFGKNGPAPAVVLFNGSGSKVDGLMDPWQDVARAEGVMLIGPGAFAPGAWRIPEDSPDFTSDVIEALKARYPIDPRRVYLAGHSGGAGHVLLLGLLESEYFAAVAAHASALRPGDAQLIDLATRKIPIAIWVGTKDDLVPIKAARETLAILTSRGFPVKLTEMNGHTHSYTEREKALTAASWEFLKKERLPDDPRYARYPFKRPQ
ncbi:MAG: PHB depolymerase family esterase [Vicinamibacterales bacterium]